MIIDIDPVDWQMHLAIFQGRVNRFEKNVRMGSPVVDDGIDLRRGRSHGITGYDAERLRHEEARKRALEIANKEIENAAVEIKLPVFNHLKPSIRAIQIHVCHKAGISLSDMVSDRRTKDVVKPRQLGMMLSKMLTPASLPHIGRQFGNRDHTTVLHALRKLECVQNFVSEKISPEDDLPVWVDVAFHGWQELGL